jgi:hypothetical protein
MLLDDIEKVHAQIKVYLFKSPKSVAQTPKQKLQGCPKGIWIIVRAYYARDTV